MDATPVLERLDAPRTHGPNSWIARCPAHDDKSPSLTVSATDDRILVHCHAGCDVQDVLKSLNLDIADLYDGPTESNLVSDQYEYRDLEGRLTYVVERLVPKAFRQRRPLADGSWAWNLEGTPKLLYRLPQVTKAVEDGRWVLFVEGEKDVHSLERAGFVATSTSGGVAGWKPELAEYLAGARVAIIPDNDAPGKRFAETVAASTSAYASEVRIVDLPNMPDKGDVSVFLNGHGGTPDQLKQLIKSASVWTPGPVITLNNTVRREIDWLWPNRIPAGKLTILAGTQGGGKSYLSLAVLSALSQGRPLPGMQHSIEPQESLFITYEDDPADTMKPRAELLGADLTKIHVWDARFHPFRVPDQLETMKALLRARPQITTIVVDPLVSCLGGVDTYRESDVRVGLGHLLSLGKTVIGIMHLTKGERDAIVYRIAGSSGFTALARSALLVEDSTVRVVKSNVAPLGQRIGFKIDADGFQWRGE